MQETLARQAHGALPSYYRLDALAAVGGAADFSENALIAGYRGLNSTQRKAADFLLRNIAGISWGQALEFADEASWRSLEKIGLAFFLPARETPHKIVVSLEHRFLLGYRDPSNFSLLEALADYRQEILTMMAAHWGLNAGPGWLMRASIFAAARDGMAWALANLTVMEDDLLVRIAESGPEGDTREELGLARDPWRYYSPQREDFMRSPPAAGKPLHALILNGLVVFKDRRQAFEADPGPETSLFVASGVNAALKALAAAPAQPVEIITPAPQRALCYADSFLRDLARLMSASLSIPVELTTSMQMGKSSLKRLAALLGMDDIPRLERLAAFLFNQGLLTTDTSSVLLPCAQARHALAVVAKNYAVAALSWRSDLDENRRRSLRWFRQRCDTPNALRAELVRRLIELPVGAWAATLRLAEAMAADRKFIEKLVRGNWHLGNTYRERVVTLRECSVDELRVLFDFGAVEADMELTTVRPSPLLKCLAAGLAPSLPPEVAEDGLGVVVQPNLEVLAPLWLPLADQRILAAAGRLKGIEHMATYAFSLETLYAGADKDVGISALRATLTRHCKAPLPRAFEALLVEFESRVGEILLMPAPALIRLRQPHLGKLIARAVGAKPLDGAPGYYYVPAPDPGSIKELLRVLRRKGYFPSVDRSLTEGRGENFQ
jgi:hypothetical protein